MSEKKSKNKCIELPIHVACIKRGIKQSYLFLQKSGDEFVWFEENTPTKHKASTREEAIRMIWQLRKTPGLSFRLLNCGRLYTLPERDEHGTPALFNQMSASFATPTGTYFDENLNQSCIVEHPSDEALRLLRKLKR